MHTRTSSEWAQGEARVARWHCCRTLLLVWVDLMNVDQQRDAAAAVPAGPSPAGHVRQPSFGSPRVQVPVPCYPTGRASFLQGSPFQQKAFQALEHIAWEFVGSS